MKLGAVEIGSALRVQLRVPLTAPQRAFSVRFCSLGVCCVFLAGFFLHFFEALQFLLCLGVLNLIKNVTFK